MVEAVKRSYPQREIADAAFELQTEIDERRRIVVGVNAFTEGDGDQTAIHKIDAALERKQIDRVQAMRARRDGAAVERALDEIRATAAIDDANLMEPLLVAARAEATEGEIVDALQTVFGRYTETPVF
jgi:methylmalonyl-CoA mutase N-terminal domain/subunit